MIKKIILTFFFLLNFIEPLYASVKDEIINNLIECGEWKFIQDHLVDFFFQLAQYFLIGI